ncbi:MAG: hypothetical protein Q8P67_00915 [archaeon]|nr:hypothetical protein [archaeon]
MRLWLLMGVVLTTVVGCATRSESAPLQLIQPMESHRGLQLVEETARAVGAVLARLDNVHFVSVVGPYHSGKSFLLNQLLLQRGDGFEIGPTVSPTTRGLWIWDAPLQVADEGGKVHNVFFLDTEGFFGRDVSEEYDAKVFAVSTLLSAVMVYNTVKTIDQSSIEYVELLARRTHLFQLRTEIFSSPSEPSAPSPDPLFHRIVNFPDFIWVVEDFFQHLEGMTATEWLHQLVRSLKRDSQVDNTTLEEIFPSVLCKTLFLPHTQRDKLQNLAVVDSSELTADFRRELDDLRREILRSAVARPDSGRTFLAMLRTIIDASNDPRGFFPQVPSMWASFIQSQITQALEISSLLFQRETTLPARALPSDLLRLQTDSRQLALEAFRSMLFDQERFYRPQLPDLLRSLDALAAASTQHNLRLAHDDAQALRAELAHRFEADPRLSTDVIRAETALSMQLTALKEAALIEFEASFREFLHVADIQRIKEDLAKELSLHALAKQQSNRDLLMALLQSTRTTLLHEYQATLASFGASHPEPFNHDDFAGFETSLRPRLLRSFSDELRPLLDPATLATATEEFAASLDRLKADSWSNNLERLRGLFGEFWKEFSLAGWEVESRHFPILDIKAFSDRLEERRRVELGQFRDRFKPYAQLELYKAQELTLEAKIREAVDSLKTKNQQKIYEVFEVPKQKCLSKFQDPAILGEYWLKETFEAAVKQDFIRLIREIHTGMGSEAEDQIGDMIMNERAIKKNTPILSYSHIIAMIATALAIVVMGKLFGGT